MPRRGYGPGFPGFGPGFPGFGPGFPGGRFSPWPKWGGGFPSRGRRGPGGWNPSGEYNDESYTDHYSDGSYDDSGYDDSEYHDFSGGYSDSVPSVEKGVRAHNFSANVPFPGTKGQAAAGGGISHEKLVLLKGRESFLLNGDEDEGSGILNLGALEAVKEGDKLQSNAVLPRLINAGWRLVAVVTQSEDGILLLLKR